MDLFEQARFPFLWEGWVGDRTVTQILFGPHRRRSEAGADGVKERHTESVCNVIVDLHERQTHTAGNDRLSTVFCHGVGSLTHHLLDDLLGLVIHLEHPLLDDANARQLRAEVVGEYLPALRGGCRADRQTRELIGKLCGRMERC